MIRLLTISAVALLLGACGRAGAPAAPAGEVQAAVATPAVTVPRTMPDAQPTSAPATIVPQAVIPTAVVVVPPTATATPAPTAAPTAEPTAPPPVAIAEPVRLVIDTIALDRRLEPVGLDANRIPIVPDHEVGWYRHSARPGEGENIVLWGHVLRFLYAPDIPAPFAHLKDAPIGAELTLYDASGQAHRYRIAEHVWATPEQVEYILPRGSEMVTLVSCIGDKVIIDGGVEMTHRLITIAVPVS